MKDFIKILEIEFKRNANAEIAAGQKAYMKNHFEFYGIKAPVRREIQKPFINKNYLPPKNNLEQIVKTLWNKPEREYQLFAQELAEKYAKQFEEKDIELLEWMVVHKSWWDSVDFIATHLIANYFKLYPSQIKKYIDKWIASENIWLQRSALLFQLNYKTKTDTKLLSTTINSLLGSKEFFINKAIGLALRSYSQTNPDWVIDFCNETKLANLSRKEALRLISNLKRYS